MVTVLICGGGNAAHVCAGISASQPGVESRVISLYADEAERWTTAMADRDFVVTLQALGKEPSKVVAKPTLVTKDSGRAMKDVDIVLFMVPAFAHGQYLEALKPYVRPGLILVGCPGQAGFEFAVRGAWGDLAREVSLLSFESLPWACRITEFGRTAEVLATKGTLTGASLPGSTPPKEDATATLQKVIGPAPKLITKGHLLGITLMGTNGYLHPSIMFDRWSGWDGKPLPEAPLFYNGVQQTSADLLSVISDEVVSTAKAIMKERPKVNLNNVTHIFDWFIRCYSEDIENRSNLFTCIQTNKAYAGLCHPCEKTESGQFRPNYQFRYLTEDIPFGLVVMRGIATVAGVATPNMDKVIMWAQTCLGKEFLVDGDLKGKDLNSTRCPQRYGLNSLDSILGLA